MSKNWGFECTTDKGCEFYGLIAELFYFSSTLIIWFQRFYVNFTTKGYIMMIITIIPFFSSVNQIIIDPKAALFFSEYLETRLSY